MDDDRKGAGKSDKRSGTIDKSRRVIMPIEFGIFKLVANKCWWKLLWYTSEDIGLPGLASERISV